MLYPQTWSLKSAPQPETGQRPAKGVTNDGALDHYAGKVREASKGRGQHFTGASSSTPAHPFRECRRVRWDNTSQFGLVPTQAID